MHGSGSRRKAKRRVLAPDVEVEWRTLARFAQFKATKLAHVAGVSLRTLQRRFRAQYGVTVSGWLKQVRLQEAGVRVKAGDRIKQVAIDLGYKQLSHFSREFKRAYGLPPRELYLESVAQSDRRS